MAISITAKIREACLKAKSDGLEIRRGPWFGYEGDRIVSCCAIGAVLLASHEQVVPEVTETGPGYVKAACIALETNPSWLYRFWMGFDRGYQVWFLDAEGKPKTKDDVSNFGIELWKELSA